MKLFEKIFMVFLIVCLIGMPSMAEEGEHEGYIVKYKGEEDFVVCDEVPISLFGMRSEIEYVEPNYLMYLIGDTPTDPCYTDESQWNLTAIGAEIMWKQGFKGEGVKIAVIDSGVSDVNGELGRCLVEGINCVEGADKTNYTDVVGHGTFVCGLIGAAWDNGGVAGIAPDVKIMPIKCTQVVNGNEVANTADVAKGVKIAVENGCKIINMSLGSYYFAQTLENEINKAYDKGAIMFAAVGNYSSTQIMYPAGYDNVIGVGAVYKNGSGNILHAPYSHKNTSVFAVAPGGCVFKNTNDDVVYQDAVIGVSIKKGYVAGNTGTSFSSPTIAAVAALALCKVPKLNHDSFAAILKDSCIDMGASGYDATFGYGMVNCEKMLGELGKGELYFTDSENCEDGFLETYIVNFMNEEVNAKAFLYEKDGNCLKDFKVHSINLKAGEGKRIKVSKTENGSGVLAFWDNLLNPIESRMR